MAKKAKRVTKKVPKKLPKKKTVKPVKTVKPPAKKAKTIRPPSRIPVDMTPQVVYRQVPIAADPKPNTAENELVKKRAEEELKRAEENTKLQLELRDQQATQLAEVQDRQTQLMQIAEQPPSLNTSELYGKLLPFMQRTYNLRIAEPEYEEAEVVESDDDERLKQILSKSKGKDYLYGDTGEALDFGNVYDDKTNSNIPITLDNPMSSRVLNELRTAKLNPDPDDIVIDRTPAKYKHKSSLEEAVKSVTKSKPVTEEEEFDLPTTRVKRDKGREYTKVHDELPEKRVFQKPLIKTPIKKHVEESEEEYEPKPPKRKATPIKKKVVESEEEDSDDESEPKTPKRKATPIKKKVVESEEEDSDDESEVGIDDNDKTKIRKLLKSHAAYSKTLGKTLNPNRKDWSLKTLQTQHTTLMNAANKKIAENKEIDKAISKYKKKA
jgi:hypothetical protein